MAILETEVWISLGKHSSYYEKLGYEIPRRVDKYGKFRPEKGMKILVKVKDLHDYSTVKVTKICDDCGEKTYNQPYDQIIKRRKEKGKERCPKCAKLERGRKEKENVKYENSLECYAKINNKEYLIKEFSNKNSKSPNMISKCTNDEYLWDCPDCNEEYEMKVILRTYHECNCPYCRGYRVSQSNCLNVTHPKIAKLLVNKDDGLKYTHGSNKYANFKCSECGNVQRNMITRVVSQGFSCKKCGDGISYPEKVMFNILYQIGIKFEKEKIFVWSKDIEHKNKKLKGTKKYDFYLIDHNIIIETHGSGHYIEGFIYVGGKSLEEEQENDRLKEDLAKNNGIKKYIVINCKISELQYIKNNILNSQLSEIFSLKNVDWELCQKYASGSLVKTVSEMWNNGLKNTVEIGEKLKLNRSTVRRYLKRGVNLNLCDYNPKTVVKIKKGVVNAHCRKIVIQMTKNGDFIKEWESIVAAQRGLNSKIKISDVCRGKRKTAGGYKWMFKTEYEGKRRDECQI